MRSSLIFPTILLLALASQLVAHGQVQGPIVRQAERSDTSKPLRELAEEAKRQERDKKPADEAEQAVMTFLKEKHPAAVANGALTRLDDKTLKEMFPKVVFYSLRFRQWPISFEVPAGMQPSNICALHGKEVTLIPTAKELETFFQKQLAKLDKKDLKRQAASAWLTLAQEMHQDGFYKFKPVTADAIRVEGVDDTKVVAQADVDPQGGNQGVIRVTLQFDRTGALSKAEESSEFKEGVRPICQATKLLDADPLVRDLLVMGSIATPYLIEQWRKADPDHQAAIEAVWDRILREHR